MAFVEGFFFEMTVFPFSRGKSRISRGVKNRGSLISAPLALREGLDYQILPYVPSCEVWRSLAKSHEACYAEKPRGEILAKFFTDMNQRLRDDNENKICTFRGVGRGG